jgi:hypothetical protein
MFKSDEPFAPERLASLGLEVVDAKLSAYDYNCFDQGELDANGTAVQALCERARRKLDELMQHEAAAAKRKKRSKRAAAAPYEAAREAKAKTLAETLHPHVASDDLSVCVMHGLDFMQGPSGNWLWRIRPHAGLHTARIAEIHSADREAAYAAVGGWHVAKDMPQEMTHPWRRPRGATTREACAKAARAYCQL